MALHPESERLAKAFISDFWSANHDIRWRDLEREHELWLDADTVLVGKIDAVGSTMDGELFFGDWKTGSKKKARFMPSEKSQWRMSPQALTYGVLMGTLCRRFTVRWALKTEPATTAFEWYEYAQDELDEWRVEILDIAKSIRALRNTSQRWPLNLHNCTRYGENYACPFRDDGCWKLKFDHVPEQMKPRGAGHLAIEAGIRKSYNGTNLVVLDASRVSDWMSCNEFYRRLWEGTGLTEENENLTIGADFHEIIASHLGLIQKEQNDHANGSREQG